MKKKSRKIKSLLFLCTGNTCRSPMAQAILEDMLYTSGLEDRINVGSAGLMALSGSPASMLSVQVCREHGIDLSGHISRSLTKELIKENNLLIVMHRNHRDMLVLGNMAPGKQIKLLSEFSRDNKNEVDISDPFGGDKEMYEKTFLEIKDCVEGIFAFLLEKRKR